MLDGWTYKRKFVAMIFAFALLFVIAWEMSLGPTFALISESAALQSKVAGSDAAYVELAELKAKKKYVESLMGSDNLGSNEVQLQLLNQIEEFSKGKHLLIKEVRPIHESKEDEYLVFTHVVIIEGGFQDLLALSNELEQNFKVARLGSVHYDKETSLRTGKQTLYATLYVQNVWKI